MELGGLEHEFYDVLYIGNIIIPTDELIFFRGVGIPPTSNSLNGFSPQMYKTSGRIQMEIDDDILIFPKEISSFDDKS